MSSWTPNSFRRVALEQGADPALVRTLTEEGNRLRLLHLPVVFTLGHLSAICGVPYAFLNAIVKREVDPYRVFRINKRQGGYRQITVPAEPLLIVQRWIHTNILLRQPVHPASMAFAPKCGPLQNATTHTRARWLVKLDITNFFESVSERQVYRVFRGAGYCALMAFQFTRLCTRVSSSSLKYKKRRWKTRGEARYSVFGRNRMGHLPQGAPTSPMLANLVCCTLDRELEACAEEFGCAYSRYADDVAFSGDSLDRQVAAELIRRSSVILGRYGFCRNRQKTHVATPGSRRIVTGLLVDGEEPKLTREFRELIEVHLYHARTKGITEHCLWRKFRSLVGFKAHLDGLITYAEHVDPSFGAKCRSRFDALPWGELLQF